MMKCQRKYKLNVVNIGVKMFSKNRDDKSEAKVSLNSILSYLKYSTDFYKRVLRYYCLIWMIEGR